MVRHIYPESQELDFIYHFSLRLCPTSEASSHSSKSWSTHAEHISSRKAATARSLPQTRVLTPPRRRAHPRRVQARLRAHATMVCPLDVPHHIRPDRREVRSSMLLARFVFAILCLLQYVCWVLTLYQLCVDRTDSAPLD
jgi:hypothetical protein